MDPSSIITVNNFDLLPHENILPIMQCLKQKDLNALSCVSTRFYNLHYDVTFCLRKWNFKVTLLNSSNHVNCAIYEMGLGILVLGYREESKKGEIYNLKLGKCLASLETENKQIIKQLIIDPTQKLILGCTAQTLNIWNLEGHLQQKFDVKEGIEKFAYKTNSQTIIVENSLNELKILTFQNDSKRPTQNFANSIRQDSFSVIPIHYDVKREHIYRSILGDLSHSIPPKIVIIDSTTQSTLHTLDGYKSIYSEQNNCLIYLNKSTHGTIQKKLMTCDLEDLKEKHLHFFEDGNDPYKIFYDENKDHVGVVSTQIIQHKNQSYTHIHIYNRKTYELLKHVMIDSNRKQIFVSNLIYLPDLNLILIGTINAILIWDLDAEKSLKEIELDKDLRITQMSYCPTSRNIVGIQSDSELGLYKIFNIEFIHPEIQTQDK